MNYWIECISEAFDDAKLDATPEQIYTVASWVEGAHESYDIALGHDVISNPLLEDNDKLRRELKIERDKVSCQVCHGEGSITISVGPSHFSTSECWKCVGEGKHSP